jgi:hypothetical protein
LNPREACTPNGFETVAFARQFGMIAAPMYAGLTCKYGVSPNERERARTVPTLAMQMVVGSSPIIRFKNPC